MLIQAQMFRCRRDVSRCRNSSAAQSKPTRQFCSVAALGPMLLFYVLGAGAVRQ